MNKRKIALLTRWAQLLIIGYLMMLQNVISKLLVYLMFLAGASYVIVHFLKVVAAYLEFVSKLELILAFPMAIGELGLAIWLIVKGGRAIAKVLPFRAIAKTGAFI